MKRKLFTALFSMSLATAAYAQDDKPVKPGYKAGTPKVPTPNKEEPTPTGPAGDADFDCKELRSTTKVQPNFENADIKEVIEWVSANTCKRFIMSEKIKGGRITIMSPTPVAVSDAYRAFEVAIKANGLALVQEGKFLKVVNSSDKEQGSIETGSVPSGDNIVTQLVPVVNGDANEMSKIMEKFKSDSGDITVYPATNLMIITDRASSLRRMVQILDEIDKPGLGEQVFIVEVKHAKASDAANLIKEVFKPAQNNATKATAPVKRPAKGDNTIQDAAPSSSGGDSGGLAAEANVSAVIPDERTNQLIVVSSKAAYEKVLYLLSKIDVAVPGSDAIHVLPLQNAKSTDLANVLSSLSKGGSPSKTPNPRGGQAANGGATAPGEAGELFAGDVKVTSDEATNSLVVVASKGDYDVLQKVVRMLDLPRRQVFIEAMIFEVSLTKNRELGVGLHGGAPAGDNGLVFGVSSNDISSLALSVLPTLTLGAFAGEPITIGGITLPPVGILLNMAAQDSEANILSNPTLLATDNEEAEITVGQNIPVPSGGNIGQLAGLAGAAGAAGALGGLGGLGALVPQISRQDIGVTLNVTPQINEGDFVTLKMEQSITAIQSVDSNGPTLSNRRATTTVTLKDQQTVVIGGLMEDRVTTTVKKIPVLGDLPLIGTLFRSQKKISSKTNLIIVLTPYIIKEPSDFARILEQKMEERRQFIEQFTSGKDTKLAMDLDYRRKKGALDQVKVAMEKAEKEEQEKAALKKDIIILPPNEREEKQPNDVPANPPAPENKLETTPNNGGASNETKNTTESASK